MVTIKREGPVLVGRIFIRQGYSTKEYPWKKIEVKVCAECGEKIQIKEDYLGPYETCPKCNWANPIGFFNGECARGYDESYPGKYTGD